jgi:hypothetical protein
MHPDVAEGTLHCRCSGEHRFSAPCATYRAVGAREELDIREAFSREEGTADPIDAQLVTVTEHAKPGEQAAPV